MRTATMLEAKWRQVLQGSAGMGVKEDESSAGHVWAAIFHHVTACAQLVHILKLMNHLIL
jgi:oligoendopeptidase F